MTEDFPCDSTPKVRCGRMERSRFQDTLNLRRHAALTPSASHKSGEYFQTRFYPFPRMSSGHPFLLFSMKPCRVEAMVSRAFQRIFLDQGPPRSLGEAHLFRV